MSESAGGEQNTERQRGGKVASPPRHWSLIIVTFLRNLISKHDKLKKSQQRERVLSVDSTVESDKLKLFKMDDNIKPIKFRLTRRWHVVLPLCISVVAIAISVASLLGALIQITQLTKEIEQSKLMPSKLAEQPTKDISTSHEHTFTPETFTAETSTIEHLKVEVETLKRALSSMERAMSAELDKLNVTQESGTTYIHWGRSQCQGDAELVYTGFGAGSPTEDHRLSGGGVQYLCLPPQPEWNKFDLSNDSLAFGWIYGMEYMSNDAKIFSDDVHGQNVVCSVCLAPRTAKMMVPAKRTCPDSWTKEYEGYLMSSYVTNHRSTFECVDERPEGINGTSAVNGGSSLYHVSGYCGGNGSLMHCPPYVHARELTCVVCTK